MLANECIVYCMYLEQLTTLKYLSSAYICIIKNHAEITRI